MPRGANGCSGQRRRARPERSDRDPKRCRAVTQDAEDDRRRRDRARTLGKRWNEGVGQGRQARNAAIMPVGATGRRRAIRIAVDGTSGTAVTDRRRKIDCVSGACAGSRRERQNDVDKDSEHRGDRTG